MIKKVLIVMCIICTFVLPVEAKQKNTEVYNGPQPKLQTSNKYSATSYSENFRKNDLPNTLKGDVTYTTLPVGTYKYIFQNTEHKNTGVVIFEIKKNTICELYVENHDIGGQNNNACLENVAQKKDNFYLIASRTNVKDVYRKTFFSLDMQKITIYQFFKNFQNIETFKGFLIENAP